MSGRGSVGRLMVLMVLCAGLLSTSSAWGGDLYVSPNGTPQGDGTRQKPLDLKTAMEGRGVQPGDTVWILGGEYEGRFVTGKAGLKDRPILYRAMPGQRVTLYGGIDLHKANVWLWGLEITVRPENRPVSGRDKEWFEKKGKTLRDAIHVHGGNTDYVKIINCVIHDYPGTGIGGWDVGRDHEYYGNLIYRNGVPGKTRGHCHAFYTQNTRPHGIKRIADNILFEGWALGLQAYGQAPSLYGFLVEGNISFCNGIMSKVSPTQNNLLVGGYKTCAGIVLRNNATYHPPRLDEPGQYGRFIKRSTDVGYIAKINEDVVLEDNWFVGGVPAIHVVNFKKAVVRRNRFYSPGGFVHFIHPAGFDFKDYVWDENTYYRCPLEKPFSHNTNAYAWPNKPSSKHFTFEEWRRIYGFDKNSKWVPNKTGRPEEVWLFKRVNEYEPERVHLAVYNWPHTPTVRLDLRDVLKPGQKFRIVDVHDIWGKPEVEGAYEGKPVELKMTGRWAPEFACYLLFREMGD